MFKLALSAGHGYNTLGKRCLKKLDPKQTREWTLNSRICNKIQEKLSEYEPEDFAGYGKIGTLFAFIMAKQKPYIIFVE